MKATDFNSALVGKRVKMMFTGLWVSGTVSGYEECDCSKTVRVEFDEPVQWGDDLYHGHWHHVRKHDNWGIETIELI